MVQTTALDRLRAEQRRARHELAAVAAQAAEFTDAMADDEQQQWLKAQIARLDPQLAQMLELRFSRSWTLSKIGQHLGLSIGTIDWRLRRALKELRDRAIAEFEDRKRTMKYER